MLPNILQCFEAHFGVAMIALCSITLNVAPDAEPIAFMLQSW